MTLHFMFLFLHNMAGEDTDQGGKSDDVLKDTSRNNEQKLHRHCEKTLVKKLLFNKNIKGVSWQSPNVEITSFLYRLTWQLT